MPPDRTPRATRPLVYFIQSVNGGPVKIGRSTRGAFPQRFASLQTGSCEILRAVSILEGDREHEMHAAFAADRIRGEWFHPTDRMRRLFAPNLIVDGKVASNERSRELLEVYERGWADALIHVRESIAPGLAEDLTNTLREHLTDEAEIGPDVRDARQVVRTGDARSEIDDDGEANPLAA